MAKDIKIIDSIPKYVPKPLPERLESLPVYPSSNLMQVDWKHDEYETDKVYENRNGKPADVKPKAFVRNAENGNNI